MENYKGRELTIRMENYRGAELNKPIKMGEFKCMVVGTGRCGTVNLAKVLSSAGLNCGHESIWKYDGLEPALDRINGKKPLEISLIAKLASYSDEENNISWFPKGEDIVLEGDSSYMAAPFLNHSCFDNVIIIHVVREPIKVINSFLGFGYFAEDIFKNEHHRRYLDFMYTHVPELRESMPAIDRAALYYIKWNKMIEERAKARIFHRIGSSPLKIINKLGLKNATYKNDKLNHKEGVISKCRNYADIKNVGIRNELIKMANSYFGNKFF